VPSRRSISAIPLEAGLVVLAAAGFALAANALSPRGLSLSRDYFPKTSPAMVSAPTPVPKQADAPSQPTNENSESAEIDLRIKSKGLQPINRAETERLFHDPRYLEGLVVFIDARDDSHYADGHIPGSYPLDRYHPDRNLSADLTPCQNAETIVVYCNGGECEDAEYAALLLQQAGIPSQKIFVYGGGYEDWSAHHLPLEQGARDGGTGPAESK
jgi:rhodanese-related sulfurtransferase